MSGMFFEKRSTSTQPPAKSAYPPSFLSSRSNREQPVRDDEQFPTRNRLRMLGEPESCLPMNVNHTSLHLCRGPDESDDRAHTSLTVTDHILRSHAYASKLTEKYVPGLILFTVRKQPVYGARGVGVLTDQDDKGPGYHRRGVKDDYVRPRTRNGDRCQLPEWP